MKKTAIAMLLLAACAGDYETGTVEVLGTNEQALSLPNKFGWSVSDWAHEICDLTDPNEVCYVPRFTDNVIVWWNDYEYEDSNGDHMEPFYSGRAEVLAMGSSGPLGVESLRRMGSEPSGTSAQQSQIIKIDDHPWSIGAGPLASLDLAESAHTYCYETPLYRGRVFGWGARIYSCRKMGIEMDSSGIALWAYLSGSSKTVAQIYAQVMRHHLGAALGQPTDSGAFVGNAMDHYLSDNQIGFGTFDGCQRDKSIAYDGSGGGLNYSPIGCAL